MDENYPHFSVGKTLSGKLVRCFSRVEDIPVGFDVLFGDFNRDELFQALAIFEYLASRARKLREDDELYNTHIDALRGTLLIEEIEGLKASHHIVTSIDMLKLGRSLVRIEFRDF